MKKKTYFQTLAFSVLLGMGMTSCSDWFDVIPRSSVYEDDLYSHEYGYQQQLTGLYLGMCDGNLYGREASFGLMDVVGGIYYLPKTPNNAYKYALQYNYEYSGTKSTITGIWEKAYEVIANANELLRNSGIKQDADVENTQGLTPSDVFTSEQPRNIICGEALAVRAYLHFDLLRMFGVNPQADANKPSIPYVTTLQKNASPQLTTGEALQKVIIDLRQAEALLKETDPIVKGNPLPDDEYYKKMTRPMHANYYAVCGMLARAYQYGGDDAEAGKWAQKVIDGNAFSWTKSAALTKGDYVGTSELVFNLFLRNMKDAVTPYFRYISDNDNENKLLPMSNTSYKLWFNNASDKRMKGFINYKSNYLSQKYVVTADVTSDSLSVQHHMPLVRLSEMYYIVSESLLSAGHVDLASDMLNHVRVAKGLQKTDFTTADAVRKEIDMEYHREFVAEGQLFYYAKRRQQPGLIPTQFRLDFVFPLPENEYMYGNRKPNK